MILDQTQNQELILEQIMIMDYNLKLYSYYQFSTDFLDQLDDGICF